jgi:hypothetical protein
MQFEFEFKNFSHGTAFVSRCKGVCAAGSRVAEGSVSEVYIWKCDVQINSKLAYDAGSSMMLDHHDVPEASSLPASQILAALVPVGLRSLFCCRLYFCRP